MVSRFFKWLAASVGLIIIIAAILVSVLPYGIRWGLTSWLNEQGHDVTVKNISVDLNDGILRITGFQTKNDVGDGFKIDKGLIQIAWEPLANRQLDIQRIELSGVELDIRNDANGIMTIGGITLPPTATTVATTTITTTRNSDNGPHSPWGFDIQQINFKRSKVCYKQMDTALQNTCLSIKSLNWMGHILSGTPASTSEQEKASLQISGELIISGLSVDDVAQQQSIAYFDVVNLKQLHIKGNNISTSQLIIEGGRLLPQDITDTEKVNYLLQWKKLVLSDIEYQDKKQLAVSKMALTGMHATLVRNADGVWSYEKWLPEKKEIEVENKDEQTSLLFQVSHLTVGGDSTLQFNDQTVKPALDIELNAIELTVNNLDSSAPDKQSMLKLDAALGKYGKIALDGVIQPFTERPTLQLAGNVSAVDLTPFTGLAMQHMGHRIQQGQLSADTIINIENGQLDIISDIVLSKFKLEAVEGKQAEELAVEIGLPLNTALSMLRDKDDGIRLNLPVTGDISSPDFNLSDIVGKVSAKAIKAAVLNFYAPFGLVSLMGKAFDLATALTFKPLQFEPGKTPLQDAHRDNLDNLIKLLQSRPQVELVLCGYATLSDKQVLFPWNSDQREKKDGEDSKIPPLTKEETVKLTELAGKRADAAKGYLVTTGNISAERVILCSPKISEDKDAEPLVKITI